TAVRGLAGAHPHRVDGAVRTAAVGPARLVPVVALLAVLDEPVSAASPEERSLEAPAAHALVARRAGVPVAAWAAVGLVRVRAESGRRVAGADEVACVLRLAGHVGARVRRVARRVALAGHGVPDRRRLATAAGGVRNVLRRGLADRLRDVR